MEEIKIETAVDILNAIKKYPKQIDNFLEDLREWIITTNLITETHKNIYSKGFFTWLPDGKHNHQIRIEVKNDKEKKEKTA